MTVRAILFPMVATSLANAILVADDDTDNREMLVEYLQAKGFTVHASANGAATLGLAEALRPRVILIDLAMHGLDGLETTRRLRANARTREATIVMVTACAFASDRESAHEAGCNFFIPKPYDLAMVAEFVDDLMLGQPQT